MSDRLEFYTIYDHPNDLPGIDYAVRKWNEMNGEFWPDKEIFMAGDSLSAIRYKLARMGLTCISREEGDDPKIIESWI